MRDFEKKILELGERRKIAELENVVDKTSTKELIAALERRLEGPNAICFWNYLLLGFSKSNEAKTKRFECVKAFLKKLDKIELTYKHSELMKRLCLDLPNFTNDQLIEVVEYSMDSIKVGDPNCVGWKDLLPEAVLLLSAQSEIIVNGVKGTGIEYKTNTIRSLSTMKWPITILTPIASMLKNLTLTNQEILTILTKFCYNLQKLHPLELPTLAFQLFSLCNSGAQIIIPIIAFQKYFHRYFYKKQYIHRPNESSDLDSIDSEERSEKEIREAQETILHHLSYCTQYKISEQQMGYVLRGLTSAPEIILTPFVLSALLSMTKANRDPDTQIPSSVILPFLRNVIKYNEDERELANTSAWCRDTLESSQVDLEQVFTILIDQNKEGKDVVTPGLVNLAFVLLRTKHSPKLNNLSVMFLQKFIKKRFVFGQGIVETLAEWMIVDQEDQQYSECLTALSLSDTFTISECVKTIKYVLDCFLKISGENAMRMMKIILPVIKISHTIRDAFIETLKKAMYSRVIETCRMGVYGFCMLLKQLSNNNSQRSAATPGAYFTQQIISGFSIQSQTTIDRNNTRRHFDMLTLEIIGLLRNCFSKTLKIKEALYENLSRAVELNPKLIPHVLGFINDHFQQYINRSDSEFEIKFEKVVRQEDENEHLIEIKDNLGQLTMLVTLCIIKCATYELDYDTSELKTLFSTIIEKLTSKDIDIMEIGGTLDHSRNQIAMQKLNFLEALMYYGIWTSKTSNNNVKQIYSLFKIHRDIRDAIKSMQCQGKKNLKKVKPSNSAPTQTQNMTINGTVVKKIVFNPINIWDLPTLERFLRLLHEDHVSFASSDNTETLRSSRDLVRYVLESAIARIESLRSEPDYKQIAHSKRILIHLTELTRILYERCIKKLPDIWTKFDSSAAYLSAECFRQSLLSAERIFKKKADIYLNDIEPQANQSELTKIPSILHKTIEKALNDEQELSEENDGKKIAPTLLQCLDILYEILPNKKGEYLEGYNWILKFCQNTELTQKDLGVAHKILFALRQKTLTGEFYNTIAINLQNVLGKIDDEIESNPSIIFKSISEATAETCALNLLNTIRKQIEEVEHFIAKADSLNFKLKITAEDDQDSCIQALKKVERSICSQLVHISKTLVNLLNVCIPLGPCMDCLEKALMSFYLCLTNLTKHFFIRQSSFPISFQSTKFDQLLQVVGKPLATRIYSLITYIETNIYESGNNRKNSDAQSNKARVIKETKFLPKLILRIENFNKLVIQLSKKTKAHLTHYLHLGTVRDFRIKTAELKEAIDQSLSHSSMIEDDESTMQGIADKQSELEETFLKEIEAGRSGSNNTSSDKEGSPASRESDTLDDESSSETNLQVLKNLQKVNVKIRKRKSKENSDSENAAGIQEPKMKKKRRKPPKVKN